MKSNHRGITRSTCVCWSITSLTSTAHGSRVRRQGRSRRRGAPHARTSAVNELRTRSGRVVLLAPTEQLEPVQLRRRRGGPADQLASVVTRGEAELEVDPRLAPSRLLL